MVISLQSPNWPLYCVRQQGVQWGLQIFCDFPFQKNQQTMSLNTTEVLKYINLARQYPKFYVALIDEQINSFTDQFNMQIDQEIIYQTIEGKSIWEDTKTFLVNQQPIRPLQLHEGLTKAAADHARDIVKTNSSCHQGSDGSTFIERIQRYCKKGKGSMIELLGTTHLIPGKNSIELAMLNFIIDDGVSNRGHRKALFSSEYKYIGVSFVVNQDKIYSVIAMSQANLEIIRQPPQSIATSTSHLKTMTEIASEIKETASMNRNTRQNIIDETESLTRPEKPPVRMSKSQASPQNNSEQVWTLKNVQNEQKVYSKKSLTSKQQIEPNQPLSVEPSVFKHIQNSVHSSTSSISQSQSSQKVCNQPPTSQKKVSQKQVASKASIKESSLKCSQHSIKSEKKQNLNSKSSSFGLTSKVQEYNLKGTNTSPFFKSSASKSGFGSTVGSKKVVEKKETIRSWNEDDYLVKEITTIVKYEDGSIEDQVQKHSILKTTSNSYIKDASL